MTPKEKAKQTAVEFLIEQLEGDDAKIAMVIGLKKYNSIIKEAKEMEKQQITDAYEDGCCYWDSEKSSEEYYNQAFNSEK